MAIDDLQGVLERLGRGVSPGSLALKTTSDGLVDLRGGKIPRPEVTARFTMAGAGFDYAPSRRPIFEGLELNDLDLSRCHLENTYWLNCAFRHVRFEGLRGRGMNFASTRIESGSFVRPDLRNANWGLNGLDGPALSDVEFIKTDLRGTTYGHPIFRRCQFADSNIKDVNFSGSRFEDCVFIGVLDAVTFNGWDFDADSRVAALRNPMKDLDFTNSELKNVAFSRGIDLTSCRFPAEGYVKLSHPRRIYERVLKRIDSEWSGEAKATAKTFVEIMLKSHFTEEQPFDVVRPADFSEPPWDKEVGEALLRELIDTSKSESRSTSHT